jgi:hypothetical protein
MRSLIDPQMQEGVEFLIDEDNREKTIGTKRNCLLDKAEGDYIVFVDDDDIVPGYYVSQIIAALKTRPDVVGINGIITVCDRNPKPFIHTMECERWHEKDGVYYRCPNHWNPVKRGLALQAGFPPINYGEDHAYSDALYPLLQTEVKINAPMYYYLSNPQTSVAIARKGEPCVIA